MGSIRIPIKTISFVKYSKCAGFVLVALEQRLQLDQAVDSQTVRITLHKCALSGSKTLRPFLLMVKAAYHSNITGLILAGDL